MNTKVTIQFDGEELGLQCGGCGLNFEIYEGKLLKDSETHFSFTCDNCSKVGA